MKIKIESDGSVCGTKVFDSESRKLLEGVKRVELSIDANSPEGNTFVVYFEKPKIITKIVTIGSGTAKLRQFKYGD